MTPAEIREYKTIRDQLDAEGWINVTFTSQVHAVQTPANLAPDDLISTAFETVNEPTDGNARPTTIVMDANAPVEGNQPPNPSRHTTASADLQPSRSLTSDTTVPVSHDLTPTVPTFALPAVDVVNRGTETVPDPDINRDQTVRGLVASGVVASQRDHANVDIENEYRAIANLFDTSLPSTAAESSPQSPNIFDNHGDTERESETSLFNLQSVDSSNEFNQGKRSFLTNDFMTKLKIRAVSVDTRGRGWVAVNEVPSNFLVSTQKIGIILPRPKSVTLLLKRKSVNKTIEPTVVAITTKGCTDTIDYVRGLMRGVDGFDERVIRRMMHKDSNMKCPQKALNVFFKILRLYFQSVDLSVVLKKVFKK